jgi:ribosomal protein S18 acetylase RimI-like enzyme
MSQRRVKIRPATLADAPRLAQLWAATFADKFGPILGRKAEPVLCDWFRLSQRHLQTTILAHIEGEVVGFIVLETPSSPLADDGRWLWHALQLHNGIFGALRGLVLLLLVTGRNDYQPRPDEVYIEMLGVDPAWQRQGIAHYLIRYAEALALREAVKCLTLNVVIDNAPALQLYKKAGFTVQAEQRSRILRWITGHSGYYEMVKEVARKERVYPSK